jgi:hypothetical protein
MAEEKNRMTWRDKMAGAQKVMECLESIDTKDDGGARKQELADVLEIAAKLLFPFYAVRLIADRTHAL